MLATLLKRVEKDPSLPKIILGDNPMQMACGALYPVFSIQRDEMGDIHLSDAEVFQRAVAAFLMITLMEEPVDNVDLIEEVIASSCQTDNEAAMTLALAYGLCLLLTQSKSIEKFCAEIYFRTESSKHHKCFFAIFEMAISHRDKLEEIEAAMQQQEADAQAMEETRLRQDGVKELLKLCPRRERCGDLVELLRGVRNAKDLRVAIENIEAECIIDTPQLQSRAFRRAIIPLLGYSTTEEAIRQVIYRLFHPRANK